MKIGLDVLGGDYAPDSTINGAIEAQKVLQEGQRLVRIGDQQDTIERLRHAGADPETFDFIYAAENRSMNEHPNKAITQKPNSSTSTGIVLLKPAQIAAFASTV